MSFSEFIAQVMFLFSLACLPLTIILFVAGIITKSTLKNKVYWIISCFAALHFWWYIKTLGTSLADKTGNSIYPNWLNHMGIALALSALLLLLQKAFPNRTKKPANNAQQTIPDTPPAK